MHSTLYLLIPFSHALYFADFYGDCVNYSNTIAEEAGFIAVQGLPDFCMSTSCAVPSASDLSQMHSFINCVGDSDANSHHHHCFFVLCTHFQISSTTSKLSCVAQTTTIAQPFSLSVLPFNKVALAFMQLAPSFERISQ
jgi:hypothetical protein